VGPSTGERDGLQLTLAFNSCQKKKKKHWPSIKWTGEYQLMVMISS
jgi:hypothetical protein